MKNQPVLERFFDKVVIDEITGCWNFTSSIGKSNCGRFTYDKKTRDAYSIGYRLLGGEVLDGQELHHECENRLCVNPEHLIPVSRSIHYGELTPHHVAYKNKRKTHCPQGHPYTEDNLVKGNIKSRHCLTCARKRSNECQTKRRISERSNGLTSDKRIKWTSEQIVEMQASNEPRKVIMKRFGISRSRLLVIRKDKSAARPKSNTISALSKNLPD